MVEEEGGVMVEGWGIGGGMGYWWRDGVMVEGWGYGGGMG